MHGQWHHFVPKSVTLTSLSRSPSFLLNADLSLSLSLPPSHWNANSLSLEGGDERSPLCTAHRPPAACDGGFYGNRPENLGESYQIAIIEWGNESNDAVDSFQLLLLSLICRLTQRLPYVYHHLSSVVMAKVSVRSFQGPLMYVHVLKLHRPSLFTYVVKKATSWRDVFEKRIFWGLWGHLSHVWHLLTMGKKEIECRHEVSNFRFFPDKLNWIRNGHNCSFLGKKSRVRVPYWTT